MRIASPAVSLLLVGLAGCAPLIGATREPAYQGNGHSGSHVSDAVLVYQDSVGPLSYRPEARGRGPGRPVTGRACQSALTLPVVLLWAAIRGGSLANAPGFMGAGWGNGGYAQAVADATATASAPGADLVNVRADLQTTVVLGLWRRQCVQVNAVALGAAPPGASLGLVRPALR